MRPAAREESMRASAVTRNRPHPQGNPLLRATLNLLAGATMLLVLLLLPGQAAAAGWTKQYYQTYGLLGIDFVDAQHGWAVGGNGSIVATTNGSAWKAQVSGTTEMLEAVDFVDTQYGWAVGYKGTIVATTNGGATWTTQPSGYSDVLWGVSFISRSQGWACGYYGAILQTTNGGATWSRVVWPFGQNLYITDNFMDVAMVDGSHGFIAGGDTIAYAVTGTPPWKYTNPNYMKDSYQAVDCVSATSAVVVGSSTASAASKGVAYVTSDGSTWRQLTTVPATSEWFNDVSMPSSGTICIAGSNGSVWTSSDAGATWKSLGQPSTGYGQLDFLSETQGWAIAGPGGSIYSYGGSAPVPGKPVVKALANVGVKRGKQAKLPFRVESSAATCSVTIKILRGKKTVKSFLLAKAKTNTKTTYSFRCTLSKGTYTWKVTAVAGGKLGTSASKKLTVK
jgi:photosystem II stability/assembly factor-like uncharacterized protein